MIRSLKLSWSVFSPRNKAARMFPNDLKGETLLRTAFDRPFTGNDRPTWPWLELISRLLRDNLPCPVIVEVPRGLRLPQDARIVCYSEGVCEKAKYRTSSPSSSLNLNRSTQLLTLPLIEDG